jgi:hypothetical protein
MKATRLLRKVALLTVGCAFVSASQAATVVFEDSFEGTVNDQNWQVYQDFGAWSTTSGTGIEVQTSGTVVNAYDGNQYVELDSDNQRGGGDASLGKNSSMTTKLDLLAGDYTVDFWYRPRTNVAGDNDINVFLDGASDSLMTNLIGSVSGVSSTMTTWTLFSFGFSVDGTNNMYALTFAAGGIANEYGGFIDLVSVRESDIGQPRIGSEVPLPAAAWLFLSVIGAGGLLRRVKRVG